MLKRLLLILGFSSGAWVRYPVDVAETGSATEFCSEKIPRNRLGMASVIPRKKVLIARHSEVYGGVNSEAWNGRKWHEKISFTKYPALANRRDSMFLSETSFGRNSESLPLFFSKEQNSEHFSLLRKGSERNSESFLFCGTAEIPTEQTNCSDYSVFRGIIFLSEIANRMLTFWPLYGFQEEFLQER